MTERALGTGAASEAAIDPVVADTGIGLEAHDETAGDAGSDHEEEND
jgi:hypothetical protein